MINNIGFKIIARKIPEFYTIFARKIPDYIIRQRHRGQAEAKTEAEAEAKIFSPPRSLCSVSVYRLQRVYSYVYSWTPSRLN